jgi:hypothetical protein
VTGLDVAHRLSVRLWSPLLPPSKRCALPPCVFCNTSKHMFGDSSTKHYSRYFQPCFEILVLSTVYSGLLGFCAIVSASRKKSRMDETHKSCTGLITKRNGDVPACKIAKTRCTAFLRSFESGWTGCMTTYIIGEKTFIENPLKE